MLSETYRCAARTTALQPAASSHRLGYSIHPHSYRKITNSYSFVRKTEKVLPSGDDFATARPPSAESIRLVRYSPTPTPGRSREFLPRQKRFQILHSSDSGMPQPWSATSIRTKVSQSQVLTHILPPSEYLTALSRILPSASAVQRRSKLANRSGVPVCVRAVCELASLSARAVR